MDNLIGKKLDGRYEILQLIGVGGMANVYKARDVIDERFRSGQNHCGKNMLPMKSLCAGFKQRVQGNRGTVRTRISSRCTTSAFRRSNAVYRHGIYRRHHLKGLYRPAERSSRWKEAVHFTVQILRALQHAHDKGIVHRDIKPQNIMLLQDGTIKVTDFGIARFARSADRRPLRTKQSVRCIISALEQARGEITDEKTDIYSVGVMLFEMLTGKLPFDSGLRGFGGDSCSSSPNQSGRGRLNPSIPEGLEQITMKAMQKDPAKRYQSAAEMLRDIDEFKRNPSIAFAYKYLSARKKKRSLRERNTTRLMHRRKQ